MTDNGPDSVLQRIGASSATLVWQNELGGLTFELDGGTSASGETSTNRRFLKWTPPASGIDLNQEVARLNWIGSRWPVPLVLDHGADDTGSWLLTYGLNGDNAIAARWRADPRRAAAQLGASLRALHDALPVATCPFNWSTTDRVSDACHRAERGLLDPNRWHDIHRAITVSQALDILADPPTIDRLVVCHGDACAPNTLLDEDGNFTGHVDLGSLGFADRWADLAVATWSTEWNYGPGLAPVLLKAYGVEPDPQRTSYYRLLWDLGP